MHTVLPFRESNGTFRFHERVVCKRKTVVACHNIFGIFDGSVRIPADTLFLCQQIAFLMHPGCIFLQRLSGICHRLQFLRIQFYEA